ncbi:hypothetical protein [Streptomyces caeruleatus]|uniref:Uncharacterized protein n=1 Tax=Streptomyces caeruleatus TaxID=661399 RepID=A0A101U8B1_9ACTN|nr:hypothetical protein [Streptomyces caeruleatus]KUO06072.1 hypothetical protein AQJ67_04560 [Streptomyces caeruleatus]
MDLELAALVSSAATAIVSALATDGWEKAKDVAGEFWRRVHPERAEMVEAELVDTRAELLAAREAHNAEAEQHLVGEWHGRLRRLLAADPELAKELQRMLAELRSAAGAEDRAGAARIDMRARASGTGRVYQAGRDQHITER